MTPRPRQPGLFSAEELSSTVATPWEVADQRNGLAAEIVFDRPFPDPYSYLVPDGLRELIGVGQRVRAPFGPSNQLLTGYCVGLRAAQTVTGRLKALDSILDRQPLVDELLLELTRWISQKYLCGWGQVLHAVIPAGVKTQAGTRELNHFRLADGVRERLTTIKVSPKQRAVLEALAASQLALPADQLSAAADCGVGPIQSLRQQGLVVVERQRSWLKAAEEEPIAAPAPLSLTSEQQAAVSRIVQQLHQQSSQTFLLHGVTGSGKTEVYIRAIEEVVSFGRQAIVLVPEISLTPQTIRRFRSRFSRVAVLHSHLTDAERHLQWRQIAQGTVNVVVGARSAVFAPTPHLGLIVIDEEHETSFKQDSTPRYHARDVARERARMAGIPLILGTATPTLESWRRVQVGEDQLLSLPRRVARRPLPPVHLIDVRDDPLVQQHRGLGRALLHGMDRALKSDGQVILFLNVRGHSPLLLCRKCGKAVRCPDCDLTLTWHQQRARAMCHACGHEAPAPQSCPSCSTPGLRFLGMGTERLEQEVQRTFPRWSCARMDSDTMQARGSHADVLERFQQGEIRILLGTQMIAKGLDFPNVTLVGVVDADTSLRQPDLRARERTFQLLAQVAGRTGRGPRGGQVLVQTCCPDDPAILFAARHDYVGFAKAELEARAAMSAPPYSSAARVIVRGPAEATVSHAADQIGDALRETLSASVGPISESAATGRRPDAKAGSSPEREPLPISSGMVSPTRQADQGSLNALRVLPSNTSRSDAVHADAAFPHAVSASATTKALHAVRVLGPAPCPITRLQGRFRYHLQLIGDAVQIKQLWLATEPRLRMPAEVEYTVDVDPLNAR
jgi:primosomal protein N' (replication factor Y) (superfamily II helicase)